MLTDGTYITIQSWMRTELKLKGNDLMVYAIIYGFSQTEHQRFTGSLQYIADWCGATKQGIIKNIKSLLEQGLIEKHVYEEHGIKRCEYNAVLNIVKYPIKHSLTNKTKDTIEEKELSSKDESCQDVSSSFLRSRDKSKKPNLYTRCLNHIDNFPADKEVRQALKTFLDSICELKKLKGETQFIGILKKLDGCTKEEQLEMINNSIEKGYGTFYKPKRRKTGNAVIDIEGFDKVTTVTDNKAVKQKLKEDIANGRTEKF